MRQSREYGLRLDRRGAGGDTWYGGRRVGMRVCAAHLLLVRVEWAAQRLATGLERWIYSSCVFSMCACVCGWVVGSAEGAALPMHHSSEPGGAPEMGSSLPSTRVPQLLRALGEFIMSRRTGRMALRRWVEGGAELPGCVDGWTDLQGRGVPGAFWPVGGRRSRYLPHWRMHGWLPLIACLALSCPVLS
ncbi:hypothetical protein BDY21DRAFT_346650 [Lineolata rhizophorae]|uniref:Uncharacterized protein n=1 Tax=Lineolata rhizophorae TaxID=578093 RepID=A0A6A6NYZ9_9PEZI|nr:hypothetical protein BDY21DRAFT_346650 [Lineolata rhizophorae]